MDYQRCFIGDSNIKQTIGKIKTTKRFQARTRNVINCNIEKTKLQNLTKHLQTPEFWDNIN